jgi:hypothetical protein
MVKKMPKNSKSRGATLSREAGLCIPRQLGRSPGQQQYRGRTLNQLSHKKEVQPNPDYQGTVRTGVSP